MTSELQQLVRELHLLRERNLQFKVGDPQAKLLLFAEASLVLLTLERFVRAVLGSDAGDLEIRSDAGDLEIRDGLR
jgi:hypothetical protein